VSGGTAGNILARECTLNWGYRTLPGDDPWEVQRRAEGVLGGFVQALADRRVRENHPNHIRDFDPLMQERGGGGDHLGHVVAQQVDASRQMASSDNGRQIFQTVHGPASYLAQAGAANSGSVTFTGPSVTDSGDAAFGTSFTLVFTVAADGTTTYSTDGGTTLSNNIGNPFASFPENLAQGLVQLLSAVLVGFLHALNGRRFGGTTDRLGHSEDLLNTTFQALPHRPLSRLGWPH